MDNEGDELELRRLLKSLDDEPDAADAWRRYHLMRSLLRHETEVDVSTDLSAGVMARLAKEPVPAPAEPPARRRLPLARSAGIAAAVSLMVITGVQFYNSGALPGIGGAPSVAESTDPTAAPVAADETRRPSLVDLPLFQTPSTGGSSGLMTVGAGGQPPMVLSPTPRQSLRMDRQQALLLQSYLDRHAEGAAYVGGDVWMPLLRASGSETLGQR